MKYDEFKPVLDKSNWIPYKLIGEMPDWMKNIPKSKIHSIYASGSGVEPKEESGYNNVIGGFDIFRYAEQKDGVNYNKDHVVVIRDITSDNILFVVETPKAEDSRHWINDIPDELEKAEILALKYKLLDRLFRVVKSIINYIFFHK